MAGCFRMLTGGGDFLLEIDFSQIDFHLACCEMDGALISVVQMDQPTGWMSPVKDKQTDKQTSEFTYKEYQYVFIPLIS